jgi:invasion protein IalB
MNMVRIAASAFALSAASIVGAHAADTAAPAVGAEPQNTSATYGDWTLRCSRNGEGDKAARVCEVALSFQIQVRGQEAPFGQLAFGRVNAKDPLHITFIMSPNVAFPSDVRLLTDEKDAQPIVLGWSICVPSFCRADGEFKDDQLKRWKALTASGQLVFKQSGGQATPITVSVRGLAQALEALAKS